MPLGKFVDLQVPARFNLSTMLLDRQLERGYGDRPALLHAGGAVTYAELFGQVARAGHLLLTLGVGQEDRVMIAADNTVESVAVWLAAVRIGAVPVPVNFFAGAELLDYFLADTGAKVAAVDPAIGAQARRWLDAHTRLKAVISLGEAPAGTVPYAAAQNLPATLDPCDTSCDDPAFWLYSSGSTGRPKGCVHLHHDLVYHVETAGGVAVPCGPGDLCYSPAKLFFGIGLAEAIWRPLAFGAAGVLTTGRTTPAAFMEAVARYRPTEVFAIPTIYAHVLTLENLDRFDVGRVQRWLTGGEVLPPPVNRAWEKQFGLPIDIAFGSNESAFTYIMTSPGHRKEGSSGVLVPGIEARLVDGDGRDVPPGEVGELLVRHDAIAAAYWGKHSATKRSMQGEWFRTGDTFYCDQDGHFFFCGRNDDLFKVHGQWVSPIEVEMAIKEHSAVVECAVGSMKDEAGLTRAKAFLVLAPGADPDRTVEELRLSLGRLPGYKAPAAYAILSGFPRTGTGKIDRRALSAGESA